MVEKEESRSPCCEGPKLYLGSQGRGNFSLSSFAGEPMASRLPRCNTRKARPLHLLRYDADGIMHARLSDHEERGVAGQVLLRLPAIHRHLC